MPIELYLREGVYWARGQLDDSTEYVRRSLKTRDKKIAEARVRKAEAEARKRSLLGPDAPDPRDEVTFAMIVPLYFASEREDGYLKTLIPEIGEMRVRDILPEYVRQLGRRLMPYAATDTWRRQIISPTRAVINNGHRLGKCPPIRIAGYSEKERLAQDAMRGKESRVEKTPGSWPWVLAFSEVAEPRDAALAYFMFRHGYRIGQSVAMTRSADMDLSAGRVRVHASKGHQAHWVQLDPEEVAMIANLQPPKRKPQGAALERVFYSTASRNLYRRWEKACKAAGIEPLKPHAAGRHGFGTEMIVRRKVDPVTAAKNLWADPSVMLKTYSHSADAEVTIRAEMAAGRALASTWPVQPNSGEHGKSLRGKAK